MAPDFAALNILIVDDDAFTLTVLGDLLRSIGVTRITTASDGHQALEQMQQNAGIEILISDLHMPDMDGIELFTELARAKFSGAIILVSSVNQAMLDSARQLAEMHGLKILGALNKPAKRDDVAALLEKY
jgi:CheY-like chemotaxis protein